MVPPVVLYPVTVLTVTVPPLGTFVLILPSESYQAACESVEVSKTPVMVPTVEAIPIFI